MALALWDGDSAQLVDTYVQTADGPVPATAEAVQPGYASIAAMLGEDPFYIAHRGGSLNWPEMSLAAYSRAVAWGAGALEVSLARTSDGVYFGLHDADLAHTSGVATLASSMTWAQVQALEIDTGIGGVAPYMRWEEIAALYGGTHVLFVDPKHIHRLNYQSAFYALLKSTVPQWQDRVVVKLYWSFGPGWGATAKAAGFTTWGYFWHDDGFPQRTTYHQNFTLLGFNYEASGADWSAMLALGKPVIGHVCPDTLAAAAALSKGAVGVMAANVTNIIPANGPFA